MAAFRTHLYRGMFTAMCIAKPSACGLDRWMRGLSTWQLVGKTL
jgi:hypothetical protein